MRQRAFIAGLGGVTIMTKPTAVQKSGLSALGGFAFLSE
jgi:hypothetical protein